MTYITICVAPVRLEPGTAWSQVEHFHSYLGQNTVLPFIEVCSVVNEIFHFLVFSVEGSPLKGCVSTIIREAYLSLRFALLSMRYFTISILRRRQPIEGVCVYHHPWGLPFIEVCSVVNEIFHYLVFSVEGSPVKRCVSTIIREAYLSLRFALLSMRYFTIWYSP